MFIILLFSCPVETNVLMKSSTKSKIVLQIPGIRFKQIHKPGSTIRCKVRLCFLPPSGKEIDCHPNCEAKQLKNRKRRDIEILRKQNWQIKKNERSRGLDISRKKIHIQLPGEM